MGWLRVVVEFAVQVTQLNPFPISTGFEYNGFQSPLQIVPPQSPSVASVGTCPGIECSRPAPFTCSYPELEAKGWEFCNTETSRDCWIRDPAASQPSFSQFDVKTDYEKDTPKGITREYWLEVNEKNLSPDGIEKILGNYFNGTYPGPTLEACWGDQLVIHVQNTVAVNGTTIHWHGIRQLNSNDMDGVNGITQCPISPSDTFTYNFTATQYGHTWYHSHYSLQYPDGVAAPLIIHGPTSANWDIDLGPILVTDWIHNSSYTAYKSEMAGVVPTADSILVNGQGHFENATVKTGSYFQTCFTPGKKHLLKLINGAIGMSFVFSIDGHKLTVVANDLVAVEPFEVDSLFIGIGQRYTVIVEANNNTDGDFWMRTVPTTGCSKFNDTPASPIDNRTAVVKYNGASSTCPTTLNNTANNACTDTSTDLLNPIVPWCVDQHPQNNVTDDTYHANVQAIADSNLGPTGAPYKHWMVGSQPMWLDFSHPTILNIDESLGNPNYTVIKEDFDRGFVYLILDASLLPVNHPIHLHGSDFVILAQNSTPWNETTSPSLFRYDNPPRRDVAILPAGGFLAIAFKPDNPGAWLLHCHIAWHASSGLALQIFVRPYDVPDFLGDLSETRRVCHNWDVSPLSVVVIAAQEDSGI